MGSPRVKEMMRCLVMIEVKTIIFLVMVPEVGPWHQAWSRPIRCRW